MSRQLSTNWSVYMLYNKRINRTYIGATTDINRRIRQHNCLIKGGARATKAGAPDWYIVCYITGFDKSTVYRWEKLIKLRAKGYQPRYDAMMLVAKGECPPGKVKYIAPDNLEWISADALPLNKSGV